MKKFFAFAMAAVSMVAMMASCGNDDDMVNELDPANKPAAPEQKQEEVSREAVIDFYLPVTDVQLEMADMNINYTIGDETFTFKPEDMTEVAFPEGFDASIQEGVGQLKYLKYRVPGTFTEQQLKGATYRLSFVRNDAGVEKYMGQHVILFSNLSCNVTFSDSEDLHNRQGLACLSDYTINETSATMYFMALYLMCDKTKILR